MEQSAVHCQPAADQSALSHLQEVGDYIKKKKKTPTESISLSLIDGVWLRVNIRFVTLPVCILKHCLVLISSAFQTHTSCRTN